MEYMVGKLDEIDAVAIALYSKKKAVCYPYRKNKVVHPWYKVVCKVALQGCNNLVQPCKYIVFDTVPSL